RRAVPDVSTRRATGPMMAGRIGRGRRLLAAAGAAVLAVAAAAAAEVRVAVVDMQRALNECDAGKRAKEQVKSKFEKAQDQLKRERDEYDKKALVLKDEERRNLEKDFENRQLDFKRKYEDFQRDLKQTDAELTSGIVQDLYGVVHDYAQ